MSKFEVDLEEKLQVCPYRVSSQSSVVDDAEEFEVLEDPCSRLDSTEGDNEPDTIFQWYRLQSFTFGATTFRLVEDLLTAVEHNPSESVELDFNVALEMSFIVRMMKKCEQLEQLWLGSNMFEDTVMIDLVRTFVRHPSLQLLSLGSFQFIPQAANKLCRLCKRKYPSKTIIYQGVIRANPARPVDVQDMLLDRCRFLAQKPKKAKQKRDFGHLMLQLAAAEETVLVREEFEQVVKRFRAKLDRPLLEALMDAFEVPKKLVDTGAMALKYLTKHPTDPPIVKQARKGKAKQ
uniref:Uncharacterized protein n=1 Tax=Anopheles stephensi TaxID=30069 RepID=A0A182YGM0_ANOST